MQPQTNEWSKNSSLHRQFHQRWWQMGLTADNVALGNKVLVVFLSALKIRAPSNVFLLLLSVIWAQQSLVICCWLLHVLQAVVWVSKSDLYSKAVGAGDPVSVPYEEVVFSQGLWHDYAMAPEVCIFQGLFLDQILSMPMVWMPVCDWSTFGVFCFSLIWKELISYPPRPLRD